MNKVKHNNNDLTCEQVNNIIEEHINQIEMVNGSSVVAENCDKKKKNTIIRKLFNRKRDNIN